MVKRKASPKKGSKAGYAASVEPKVADKTSDSESTASEPSSSSSSEQSEDFTKTTHKTVDFTAATSTRRSTTTLVKSTKKPNQNVNILKNIKQLQRTTNLLIPKAPFLRLVREIMRNRSGNQDLRITETALEALREASECVITGVFEDSYLLALHAKRVTLFPRDMQLMLRIRNDMNLVKDN